MKMENVFIKTVYLNNDKYGIIVLKILSRENISYTYTQKYIGYV